MHLVATAGPSVSVDCLLACVAASPPHEKIRGWGADARRARECRQRPGYVGGAPNKINLYVKHTPVKFNIPQEEAVERLVDLIKEYGRWVDPK